MGVRFLLDTHVLLWLLSEPGHVPTTVRDKLADRGNGLLVSAASALEISTKIRIGKLDAADLPTTLSGRVSRMGASTLPISFEHALLAGAMVWDHRDPFDRLLIAQATIENATLVTVDRVLAALPAPRVLSW